MFPLFVVVQLLGCFDCVEQCVLLDLLEIHDCDSEFHLSNHRIRWCSDVEFVIDRAARDQTCQRYKCPSKEIIFLLLLTNLCANNWSIVIEENDF